MLMVKLKWFQLYIPSVCSCVFYPVMRQTRMNYWSLNIRKRRTCQCKTKPVSRSQNLLNRISRVRNQYAISFLANNLDKHVSTIEFHQRKIFIVWHGLRLQTIWSSMCAMDVWSVHSEVDNRLTVNLTNKLQNEMMQTTAGYYNRMPTVLQNIERNIASLLSNGPLQS